MVELEMYIQHHNVAELEKYTHYRSAELVKYTYICCSMADLGKYILQND